MLVLSHIDDLIDKIGNAKCLTKMDLSKGYYQVRLDEESRPVMSFITPFGFYRWQRLPMGMKTSRAAFNSMLS